MLILYVQDRCPFSAKVIKAGEQMGVAFELRNISDEIAEKELMSKGGKLETPYLVDTQTNTQMYESDAIVSYLISRIL